MHIYLEEPDRLKITLTGAELRRLSLSYDQLDYDDPVTRRALGELMAEARAETGFDFQPGRLLIEVFPASAGGCEMYFTLLADTEVTKDCAAGTHAGRRAEGTAVPERRRAQQRLRLKRPAGTAYTFEFESAEDMLAAMERLYGSAACAADSDLYAFDGRYRLVLRLRPGERFSPMTLSEYCAAFYRTAAAAACTAEHGRLLAGGRAVDLVGGALLRRQA